MKKRKEKRESRALLNAINYSKSRKGYSTNLRLDGLITKIRSNSNQKLINDEIKLALEILDENINHIAKYSYDGLSYIQKEKLRNEALAPLKELKSKLME